ncbi:MAG: hypothetical protein ACI4MN_02645 [Candidatus Coproplasma sp.]
MKLTKTLTLSLAAMLSAASIGVGSAFAAEQPQTTYYPDSFECSLSFDSGLTDYAVYGDSYAFAYSGQLAVLKGNGNDERLPDINPVSYITALEYSPEGELYVCFSDGYCIYPDMDNKYDLSGITVQGGEQYLITVGEIAYFLNNSDGSIQYMDKNGPTTVTLQQTYEGEVRFSKLKSYNDTAYAVMNNCLYKMEGATAIEVEPTYYGYADMTKAIATGSAAESLKADSPITYGWIESDKYYTEISLASELGETFVVPDTATATRLSEDRLFCIVLAESGNAYIVTMNGKSYLAAKSSVTLEAEHPALTPVETQTAYAIEKTGVYSRPYLCEATKLCELESRSNNAVTVLGMYTDLTGIEYYKVTYQSGEATISGYVAKSLMTVFPFPAEDDEFHTDGGDKQFIYDTNIVTVVLAVAIVAMVIIAILYIAATFSKRNKKRRQKEREKERERRRRKEERKRAERQRRRRYDDDDYEDDYDDEDDYED